MRVIAGKFKGKKLSEFELETTRPTSDLVKGACFNILGEKVNGSVFLDLFSGTGAIGIEALSRDAKICYFVENNKDAVKLIEKNIKSCNIENYKLIKTDCFEALKNLQRENIKFDIIFLDPPYKTDLAEKCIRLIQKYDLLNKNGIIMWEHDKTKLDIVKSFNIENTRKYGIKYLTKLTYEELCKIK
ncbi:MAG: 16S rRNA (guanine(966)-N(2))-methyltransferase RsmD [Clostridiales bacterium]|nr:16S rRNA (guanine(966)-N(2))-methyltransferase RsmD [Candidatus Apopatousia equi]